MRMCLQGQTLNEQFARPGHIVVATNLGDLDFLLPHAIAQAKTCGATLTLAHAVTGDDSKVPFGTGHPGQFEMHAEELDTAMRKVKAEGVNCTSQIAHALLPDEFLHNVVRELGAQRVITASHGRGNLAQVTLGSVAHQLLSTLKVPVFVVGPKSQSQSQHCYPKRILHPVSFSGGYRDSVEFARNIAELHNAELMLIHVLDPDLPEEVDPARTVQWAKDALDSAIPDRTTVAVPLRTHVASGNIVKEILKTAATFNADWIVFGTTPSSYAPLLANSAAYKIMATLDIPVLTFPHRIRSIAAELEEMEMPAQAGHSETDYL